MEEQNKHLLNDLITIRDKINKNMSSSIDKN